MKAKFEVCATASVRDNCCVVGVEICRTLETNDTLCALIQLVLQSMRNVPAVGLKLIMPKE